MKYYELEYDSYDEYLNGPEWHAIRDYIYDSKIIPYHCKICHARKKLLLHKRSYAYLLPEQIRKLRKNILRKIFVYFCHKCNNLVHFKKKEKIPLDYLFLSMREGEVYWRVDKVFFRFVRTTWSLIKWFYFTYKLGTDKKRRR